MSKKEASGIGIRPAPEASFFYCFYAPPHSFYATASCTCSSNLPKAFPPLFLQEGHWQAPRSFSHRQFVIRMGRVPVARSPSRISFWDRMGLLGAYNVLRRMAAALYARRQAPRQRYARGACIHACQGSGTRPNNTTGSSPAARTAPPE